MQALKLLRPSAQLSRHFLAQARLFSVVKTPIIAQKSFSTANGALSGSEQSLRAWDTVYQDWRHNTDLATTLDCISGLTSRDLTYEEFI